jgi:hypothetical protein
LLHKTDLELIVTGARVNDGNAAAFTFSFCTTKQVSEKVRINLCSAIGPYCKDKGKIKLLIEIVIYPILGRDKYENEI